MSNNKYVLEIKTVQIAPFRTLMTALKDILLETNITFQKDGIRIINMDKSHTIVVHLFLPAESFESFECKKDKIIIGANILNFFKFLSMLETNETLTIYIKNDDYCDGIVTNLMLKFENEDKGSKTVKGMKLIDPDIEEMICPDIEFSSIINMPSVEFQKNIKNLNVITDKVEIKSVGSEVIFSGKGELGTSETTYNECEGNLEFIKKQSSSKIIQGEFSLKNLGYFIKCTSLCPNIEIYLENDIPLIVKYNVASLGEIKLCLAPLPSSN